VSPPAGLPSPPPTLPASAPIVPRLGAVGAGRSVGHAIGAAAARTAAERRFLGADPRASALHRVSDDPSAAAGEATVIDPRHPAARQARPGDEDTRPGDDDTGDPTSGERSP